MINCIVFSDFTNGTGKTPNGDVISNEALASHAAAVQEQLCGAFADAWDGAKVYCRVGAPNGEDVGPNERLMGYWQHPDIAGAAGYHATDPSGRPYGKVFLDDAATMSNGPQAASVIASHEACELTLDPTANLLALRLDGLTFDAYEACDAVEDTTYTASNGVEVSNFLTPAAFDPGAVGPYDKLGVLQSQYGMTPGGYRITGTASIAQNGAMKHEVDGAANTVTVPLQAKIEWKAEGLDNDPAKRDRKLRECGRARRRGVNAQAS
jgi:hypothetical protein